MANQTTQTVTYQSIVAETIATVKADRGADGKWKALGVTIAKFFQTREALEEIKAQFCADAILPGIDARYARALDTELPRKNGKAYNLLSDTERLKWATINQNKKDARSIRDTMFTRVVHYAFPSAKTEGEGEGDTQSKSDDVTKITKYINDAINKAQKTEALPCPADELVKVLRQALAMVSQNNNT